MVRSIKNPKKAKRKHNKGPNRGDGSSSSMGHSVPTRVWQPGVDKIEEDEELQCDISAYNSLHAFHIGWACLRIEDVLAHFATLPPHIRQYHIPDQELQDLLQVLGELKNQTEEHLQDDCTILAVQEEFSLVKEQLQSVQSEIRKYEPLPETIMTIAEANISEGILEETLAKVQERKRELAKDHDNDTSQPSGSMVGAENPSANQRSADVQQPEPEHEHQQNQDSDKNQDQMPDQSPTAEGQVTSNEHSPPQSLLLDMDSLHPHQAGTLFSSLLLATDVAETLSPFREIVPPSPTVPFVLPSQPPGQNNNGSIQQNQFSDFHDGDLNTQFFPNSNSTGGNQFSESNGNVFETPNGYNFPASNLPSPDFQIPSSPASFQMAQQMQLQLHSSTAFPTAMQPPYYQISQQMPVDGSTSAPLFTSQGPWSNQSTLQQNPTHFGPTRGGFQDLLNSVGAPDSMLSDAGSASYLRTSDLQAYQQVMGGHSLVPNLSLNLQEPLANTTSLGMHGNVMPTATGDTAGEPSSGAQKRKFPWDDDVSLRLSNNENGNAGPPALRPLRNLVYNTSYEAMSLPIDPHLRMFEEFLKNHNDQAITDNGDREQQNQ